VKRSCEWFPLSYDQIKAWVEAHASDLPRTLAELSAFPIAFRRVIVAVATPERRIAFWREQYEDVLARDLTLDPEQRAVIADAIALLPMMWLGDRIDAEPHVRALMDRAHRSFEREQATRIFYRLGPPEPPEGLPLPTDAAESN